jgi:hypothetical protein
MEHRNSRVYFDPAFQFTTAVSRGEAVGVLPVLIYFQ